VTLSIEGLNGMMRDADTLQLAGVWHITDFSCCLKRPLGSILETSHALAGSLVSYS
jgi:hypothetical protein